MESPKKASCAGSKLSGQPVPNEIVCSSCKEEVELWSDEEECPSCGCKINNSGTTSD